MDDWSAIAIRFATYATLCLAFGAPLQSLFVRGDTMRRVPLALLIVTALACSTLHLLALVAAMAGVALFPVDRETLHIVLTDTSLGTAFVVRFVALACALAVVCIPGIGKPLRLGAIVAGSGTALATSAWAGHGVMDEGWRGVLHLAADIVHLLAAGAWIGAIAVFLLLLVEGLSGEAAHALERFAPIGSILVALLVATGLVNVTMILGLDALPALGDTTYGRILLVKVALFAGMLGAAALNRWVLTPRIARMGYGAARALRASLSVELALGLLVLAAVGWLGALSPES